MKMQAELDAKHFELETELNHSQMEQEILLNDLKTRSSQLEECKQHALHLESQLIEARSKETELVQASEASASQLRSSEEKLERVSEKFKKLAVNYKQKLALIQQLSQQLDTLKKVGGSEEAAQTLLLQSQGEVKNLSDQLDKLKGSADELNRVQLASVAYQNDLQSARSEMELFTNENRTLLEQLNHLQAEVDHLRQGASHSANKVEEYSLIAERLQRDLDASHDRLRMLSEKMVEEDSVKDGLNQQVEESSQRNAVLAAELDQLRMLSGKIAQEETVRDGLNDELHQVKIQLEKANSVIEFKSNELSQFQQYFTQVADEKENLLSHNQSLQQQLYATFADMESKKALIIQLEEEVDALKATDDLTQVKAQLENANSLVDLKTNEIAELHQKLNDLSTEKENVASASVTAAESMRIRIVQLEEELAASTIHSAMNNSLTDELNQARTQLENANSSVDFKSKETAEIQQQLNQVLVERENIIGHNSGLQARIFQLEQELSALHHRVSSSELIDKSNICERCPVLEKQVHELNIQYSALYASFSSQLHEYAMLEQQKVAVDQQKVEAEERNNILQIQLNESTSALAQKEAELTEKTEAEKQKAEVADRNNSLQIQLDESTAILALKELELAEKAEAEERFKVLEVQLNESAAVVAEKNAELGGKLSAQLEENESVRNLLAAAEQELQQLQEASSRQAAALICEKEAELAELLAEREKMASDVKEIGLLRMNLADMMSDQDDLNYQIEDYQSQIQHLESKTKLAISFIYYLFFYHYITQYYIIHYIKIGTTGSLEYFFMLFGNEFFD